MATDLPGGARCHLWFSETNRERFLVLVADGKLSTIPPREWRKGETLTYSAALAEATAHLRVS